MPDRCRSPCSVGQPRPSLRAVSAAKVAPAIQAGAIAAVASGFIPETVRNRNPARTQKQTDGQGECSARRAASAIGCFAGPLRFRTGPCSGLPNRLSPSIIIVQLSASHVGCGK